MSAGVATGTVGGTEVWSEEVRISAVASRMRFTRLTSLIMKITQARMKSVKHKSANFGQRSGGVGGGAGGLMEV